MRFLFIAISVGLATGVSAQTTVSTPIAGFQKFTAPSGLSAVGFPLLNEDIVKTTVGSLASTALTLSGETNVGSKLASGEPYYVEVYSGALKGDRFDIDTAATISAANGTVVLNSASANNTYAIGSIAAQLDGATVALRKHITVQQIQNSCSPSLVGNNNSALADQIQVFDPSLQRFVAYYLRGNLTEWRLTTSPSVVTKAAIPPGSGIMILRRGSSSTEVTTTGYVRQNDFALPYKTGQQLLAPPVPIDYSPASLGASGTNGWTGNNNSSLADKISIYSPETASFVTYYLRTGGTEWRIAVSPTVVTSSNVISSSTGFFVDRKSDDLNNILVNPISP